MRIKLVIKMFDLGNLKNFFNIVKDMKKKTKKK